MTQANRYIILGSGIAGMAAAEAIRAKDPEGIIRMISAEEELCFNRPMLIREFALDGSGAALFEKQQDWPGQVHVDVQLGTRVEEIDPKEKRIRLADQASNGSDPDAKETWESYDKLIYTLGAEVMIPPISGVDLPHVHVVRTREDMRRIRAAMKDARHAVVVGGGMLGLEDAWAMKEQKLDVSIIEQNQRVAFGQIDQSAGNLMKKRIERMGVPVYVNAAVEEIGDGYVTFRQPADVVAAVLTEEGPTASCPGCGSEPETESPSEAGCAVQPPMSCPGCQAMAEKDLVTIPADLVILSTGVTPNSVLGASAGLATADRWIAVDEHCRTSDPDIYAAGDAAAVNGRNDAIWDEAREMGRVAGTNAATSAVAEAGGSEMTNAAQTASAVAEVVQTYYPGELEVYVPVTAEHVFTGFDTEVFTMADSSGAGTDGVYIRHADVEIFDYQRERYIRVSLQDGIIAGILLINASELAPELMDAYHRHATEEEARQIVLRWRDSHEVDFKPATHFRRR